MKWRPSLAASFATLAIAICGAATVLCIVDLTRARGVAVGVARRQAENHTQALSRGMTNTLDAASRALDVMASQVSLPEGRTSDWHALTQTINAIGATLPRFHDLAFADARGELRVGIGVHAGSRQISVANQMYFAYHRTHRDTAIYVSGPAASAIDGSPVLYATRRIERPDGSFGGVAIAAIACAYFQREFTHVDINHYGTVALLKSDGTTVARIPASPTGTTSDDSAIFQTRYRDLQAVSYVDTSGSDGKRRLFAFERLEHYPLIVEVGLAESEYLASWEADAFANYLALAFGTAVIGALATGLGVQMTHRRFAEKALAASSTDALTGLANRHRFESELAHVWQASTSTQRAVGLLMVEVGNLKAYNDRFGHEEGDLLLVEMASALVKTLKHGSFVARYDGLKFAALSPGADAPAIRAEADRGLAALHRLIAARTGSATALVPVHIGCASVMPVGQAVGALVAATFVALHEAKHADAPPAKSLNADALTRLANRRQFDSELAEAWYECARSGRVLGLILLEIDNLRAFNEHYGRDEGDDLLISIGHTVASLVPAASLVARYNGSAFAVIIRENNTAASANVAQSLSVAIHELTTAYVGTASCTATVGVGAASFVPNENEAPVTIVSAAFSALHLRGPGAQVAATGAPEQDSSVLY